MLNCMTYALKLEGEYQISSSDTHFYSGNVAKNFDSLSKKISRCFREIDGPSSILKDGEWLVAFIGFFPYSYDYEGLPEIYDCHFMLYEDGKWTHRPGAGQQIEPVPDSEFTSGGPNYPVRYFAVRRVEV